MTPTWQTAHAMAATIPSLYTRERKREVKRELCRMWRQMLVPH